MSYLACSSRPLSWQGQEDTSAGGTVWELVPPAALAVPWVAEGPANAAPSTSLIRGAPIATNAPVGGGFVPAVMIVWLLVSFASTTTQIQNWKVAHHDGFMDAGKIPVLQGDYWKQSKKFVEKHLLDSQLNHFVLSAIEPKIQQSLGIASPRLDNILYII